MQNSSRTARSKQHQEFKVDLVYHRCNLHEHRNGLAVTRIKGEDGTRMEPDPISDRSLDDWLAPPRAQPPSGPPSRGPAVNWLFLDLNSYFASVEQQDRPELRGKPVGVVPMLADTTCCIAASYEAKASGVRTGTIVADAKRLCPDIILVEGRHELYTEYHHRVRRHPTRSTTSSPNSWAGVTGRVESARTSELKPDRGYLRLSLAFLHVGAVDVPLQTASLFARQDSGAASLSTVRLEKGRRLTFRLTEPVSLHPQRTQASR